MFNKHSLRFGALTLCLSLGQLASAATIRFDRASIEGLAIGERFSLEVLGSEFAEGSAGGGLNVNWNPDVLAISSLSDIELLFPGDKFVFEKGTLNGAAGTLSNLSTNSFTGIADAGFKIARITFTAVAAGTSAIELDLGAFTAGGLNAWTKSDGSEVTDLVFESASVNVAPVPLPAALFLMPGALALLGVRARFKKMDHA